MEMARDLLGKFGFVKFFGIIIPWMFFRRYIICSQAIRRIPVPPSPPLPFRLEVARESDLCLLLGLRPHFFCLDELRRRLQDGHLCFLGWSGDRVVHVRWIFVRSLYVSYLHRHLNLSGKEVFSEEAYTDPAYRSLGIYAYAGALIRRRLFEMGYRRISCVFASWNTGPLNLAGKIGLNRVGKWAYLNGIFFKKFFWSGKIQVSGKREISLSHEE